MIIHIWKSKQSNNTLCGSRQQMDGSALANQCQACYRITMLRMRTQNLADLVTLEELRRVENASWLRRPDDDTNRGML